MQLVNDLLHVTRKYWLCIFSIFLLCISESFIFNYFSSICSDPILGISYVFGGALGLTIFWGLFTTLLGLRRRLKKGRWEFWFSFFSLSFYFTTISDYLRTEAELHSFRKAHYQAAQLWENALLKASTQSSSTFYTDEQLGNFVQVPKIYEQFGILLKAVVQDTYEPFSEFDSLFCNEQLCEVNFISDSKNQMREAVKIIEECRKKLFTAEVESENAMRNVRFTNHALTNDFSQSFYANTFEIGEILQKFFNAQVNIAMKNYQLLQFLSEKQGLYWNANGRLWYLDKFSEELFRWFMTDLETSYQERTTLLKQLNSQMDRTFKKMRSSPTDALFFKD